MNDDGDKVKQLLQNTPEEQGDEPELPEDMVEVQQVKPHGRRLLHWLVGIIVVLMLALGGLLGWLWWRDHQDNDIQQAAVPATSEGVAQEQSGICPESFTHYANSELNVVFCHLQAWGEVAQADATFSPDDTGTRWRLLFSDMPDVNVGLVSGDWATTEPRDGTCVDPAVQTLPDFTAYTDDWTVTIETDTAPPQPSSAHRSLEAQDETYYIVEEVDDLLTNGVCIRGYAVTGDGTYSFVAASFSAVFSDTVATPQAHIDNPRRLVPEADRAGFVAFVTSIEQYEEA